MRHPTCPVCDSPLTGRSPADCPWFPFCSQRCKTIDLGRWLSESYSIPAADPDEVPVEWEDS